MGNILTEWSSSFLQAREEDSRLQYFRAEWTLQASLKPGISSIFMDFTLIAWLLVHYWEVLNPFSEKSSLPRSVLYFFQVILQFEMRLYFSWNKYCTFYPGSDWE